MQAKRWISGLVACAMLATMMPIQAMAAEISSEPAEPATWQREYDADALYELVQDELGDSKSIDLAKMIALPALANNESDDGQMGQLTAVSFDDDTIDLASLESGTSYTLTFADDEPSTEEGTLPEEPETNPPAAETETGTVVDQPGEAAPENDPAETPDPTGPPEGTDDGQEGDTSLTVTETVEQSGEPTTAENGETSLAGATMTVGEKQVDKVTLTYTEIVAEDDAETQDSEESQTEDGTPTEEPTGLEGTNALQTAQAPEYTIEVEVGSSVKITTKTIGKTDENAQIKEVKIVGNKDIASADKSRGSYYVTGKAVGDTVAQVTYETGYWGKSYYGKWQWNPTDSCTAVINVTVTGKDWGFTFPEGSDAPTLDEDNSNIELTKVAVPVDEKGQWKITLTAEINAEVVPEQLELVLVLDNSNSMHGNKLKQVTEAAKELLRDLVARGLNVKVSIVRFAGSAETLQELTELNADTVDSIVQTLPDSVQPYTNVYAGLLEGVKQFSTNKNQKSIIILSDGESTLDVNKEYPLAYDIRSHNINLYGVGFQDDSLSNLFQNGYQENYYTANDTSGLETAFGKIANQLSAMIVDSMGDAVELVGDEGDVTVTVNGREVDSTSNDWGVSADGTIYWNPDTESVDDTTVEIQYTVQNANLSTGEHDDVRLNGEAKLTYYLEGNADKARYQTAEVPIGTYSAGQLNQEFKTEDGAEISDSVTGKIQYLSWGVESGEPKTGVTEFTWSVPDESITKDSHGGSTTYYYNHSYIKYTDGNVSKSFDARKTLKTEARPEVVTVVHVYSEHEPDPVTAGKVIESFYKRLDMGDRNVRAPYLDEAFEGGDTFSFTLSKLEAKQDSDTEYEITGDAVATATVEVTKDNIMESAKANAGQYHFYPLGTESQEELKDGYYILQEDFKAGSTVDNTNNNLSWKNANGERKGEHGYIIHVENGEVTYKPNMKADGISTQNKYEFKGLDGQPSTVYPAQDKVSDGEGTTEFDPKFNNVFENDFASYSVKYSWDSYEPVGEVTLPASAYYSEDETVTVEDFDNADVYATKDNQTYKFTGWEATTSNPKVEAPSISSGQFNMPAANVTLTAQWQRVYTVQDVLAQFQKLAVADEGTTAIPEATFNFTLTEGTTQIAKATAMVSTANTPVDLQPSVNTLEAVLNGDLLSGTTPTYLEQGDIWTLMEDTDSLADGWKLTSPVGGYTISIGDDGAMTVTGGDKVEGTGKYLFTNTYTEPVSAPDLKDGDVVKTSDASDGAAVGETVTYTVTTTFTESGTIDKITLADTVGQSLSIQQAYFSLVVNDNTTNQPVSGIWNSQENVWEFNLGIPINVNIGDKFVVEYTYTLPETLEDSTEFTNEAQVTAYYNNTPGTPDTGEETIKIVPGVPEISSVTKVAGGDHHYAPGETVEYIITTTFAKEGKLDKFTVKDDFFPNVSNIRYWFENGESGVVAQPAFDDNVLTVALVNPVEVTANSTLTISYQYTIPENQPAGKLTNTATVTVSYKDVEETHRPVTETVTVEEPKPELSVEKALTKVNGEAYTSGMVNSGDVLTYQITIANTGNADARGDAFNVTDSMWQKNITNYKVMFTNAQNQTSDVTSAYPLKPDTFTVEMIPAHTKYVVTYDYTVDLSDEGTTLRNTVRLTGQNQDVDLSDTVEVDVEKTHCLITYTYESGTAGKELPDEGLPQVPGSETVMAGTTLSLPGVDPSTVKTEDGTWTFRGWYYNGSLINPPVVVKDDMDIVGLWTFEENQYANLTVTLVSGEKNGNYGLPFSGLEPQTAQVQIGTAYSIVFDEGEGTISVPTTLDVSGINYAYDEAATKELNGSENPLSGTMPEKDIEVKVAYSIDILGGEDPENPGDGIPDRYQFTIEYVVADGQEAMGTVSPVGKNVYTIYQDGVLSAGPVTVSIDGDVIKAGVATAQDGYVFENWTLNDVDLSAIGVDDDLTGYQMMGVTGGQTYTFVAHFTKNYTVQDVLNSFVKEVTLADGVENFPASAEFKFALTKEGGSPTYGATTGEVSGMTAERSIPIVTYATDILADGTYYLTETVMDAGWTLTTPADGYKITIDHGTMSVNDEPVTEGEPFAFENTYNGAPSLEVEKTVVDAEGNNVTDAVYRDGDPVYFKIAVTAKGGWPVEDVTVTDTLPAGLTVDAQAILYPEFHNFRGSLTNVDGKTVEIRINTATPTEDTVWVIIPAIVDAPETYEADAYTNIAVINDGDPDTEDPSGETTIQVEAVSVVKALTPNNSPYNIGQTAQYYIVVTNTGNTALRGLTVAEQLPEGLQLTDSEVNAGWNDGVYTIDFLNPGDSYPIWAEVQIMDYAESYPNVVVVKDSEETDLGQAEDDTLEANPNHTVTVRYEWQDASGVTVGNETKTTLEAAHDSRWKASVSDDTSETLTDAANLVVAKMFTVDGKQYAFKGFAPAQTSGSVTGDVTITAVYGLDETGTTTDPENPDPEKPDGIPDEYQATVTYRVVNGTWSDGSSTDRTEVFTLYTYDPATAAWTEIEHVTLGNTIPTGMQANAGYAGQSGAWNTAITAETQVTGNVTYIYRFGEAAPDEIIVYYDDDGSGYGEITSEHRQVFTADNWQTITGDPTHVRIHLTATAEDDGGRTYFDEWQGSLVDDLDDDIREDEELSAWVVAEIGQTYTVIADFGRRSSGGGGGGGNRDDDDDEEEIIDEEVPLAETPWLNTVDHYAYIVGYAEDGTVRPNANITRAEVATIFFRLLTDEARNSLWSTTNTFSDVASTAWYNTAVSTMANAGIIQGYEDGTFRPNANITRAEFAAIAARFMTSGYDVESDLFTDIAGHWARESINDAATAGWINGYSDDTFRPDNAITRAEAVTLVNNVLQRKPDADHMLDSMITWPDNPESAWYYEAIQEATNSHDYDMPSEDDDVDYETWTALQENRDWAALEAQWSAEHAYGGDVM